MIVIGMTGGIGCGKSSVSRYLAEKYNAALMIADDVANAICEPGGRVYEEVKALLGKEYYNEDGTRNRAKIGDRAFKEPALLEALNRIIHPAVRLEIEDLLKKAEEEGRKVAVIESAILVGAGYRDLCTEYWYVYVEKEERIRRLLASRPITREKIESVMESQLSEEAFKEACEFLLDNTGTREETRLKVDARIAFLCGKNPENREESGE